MWTEDFILQDYNCLYKYKNFEIPIYKLNTLVIGSGCAGLNAADWLCDLGVCDIALATEGFNMGTSRNTGSDKQTYYKLSMSSGEEDGIGKMAKTLFDGKSVNGDTALCEAAGSAKSFMKLAILGVPFPTNEYGEYAGYMPDHDVCKRATSAGPLTSKYMTEALEKSVRCKDIRIFDNVLIVRLICDENKIIGAIGIDKNSKNMRPLIFECENIILATGGSAGIYQNSVYPCCHTGMTSLAVEAGAKTSNLQEWQYGLASVDFRWNVSGTYQQVIPRYVSVDKDGNEREFLNDYFKNPSDTVNFVFQKGYQWPFDSAKIKGSSIIDMIIFNETVNKKNKVYMDFTKEPKALENGFESLSDEAYNYLKNSGALIKTPIKRLEKMNKKAIDLYAQNGIDLYNSYLRVEVCAQHNNGGIAVDKNWQTNIDGLYAAGEAAGTFGVYRPGGSALNSTQVGSMRAAEHIAYKKKNGEKPKNIEDIILRHSDIFDFIFCLSDNGEINGEIYDRQRTCREKMSNFASYIRIPRKMAELKNEFLKSYGSFFDDYKNGGVRDITALFKLRDSYLTSSAVLCAMLYSADKIGTRGGSLVCENIPKGKEVFDIEISSNAEYDGKTVSVCYKDGEFSAFGEDVREIPKSELWFENVWNEYLKRCGK